MPRRRKPEPIDKASEAAQFARAETVVADRNIEVPPKPVAADPIRTHGPSRPARTLYGVEHLRAATNLRGVDIECLCEDAACELERLRESQRPRFRWD